MQYNESTNIHIQQAVAALNAGKLVAFPTETVYGLGADACNNNAIQKVFEVKQRPNQRALIIHIADETQIDLWAKDVPEIARIFAKNFWPGPLTLVLPKKASTSDLITGGQNTVALRVPKHPLTLELLRQFGSGIVGPSANTYGHPSPINADQVRQDLGEKVDVILDGGNCELGMPSTIVGFSDDKFNILRQGSLPIEKLLSL